MDNVDPAGFDALFDRSLPAARDFWLSPNPVAPWRTLAQFIHCFVCSGTRLENRPPLDILCQFCEPGPRPLRYISERHGIDVLDHPLGLGGRFRRSQLLACCLQ